MKKYTVEIEVMNIKTEKQAKELAEDFYNMMFNRHSLKFDGKSIPIENVTTRVVDEKGHIPYSNK